MQPYMFNTSKYADLEISFSTPDEIITKYPFISNVESIEKIQKKNCTINMQQLYMYISNQSKHLVDCDDFSFIYEDKIILEYVSANPNGELHVGHLLNAIIGDAIKHTLLVYAKNVESHYFVNNTGGQMAKLLFGIQSMHLEEKASVSEIQNAYIFGTSNELKNEEIIDQLKKEIDHNPTILFPFINTILNAHLTTLQHIGLKFDQIDFESTLLTEIPSTLDLLDQHHLILHKIDENGKVIIYLNLDNSGIVTKFTNGTYLMYDTLPTYTLKDIVYSLYKSKLGYCINVQGVDHIHEGKVITYVLQKLGYKTMHNIHYGFVSLHGTKISKKKGNIQSVTDILSVIDTDLKKMNTLSSESNQKLANGILKLSFLAKNYTLPSQFDVDTFNIIEGGYALYETMQAQSVLAKKKVICDHFNIDESNCVKDLLLHLFLLSQSFQFVSNFEFWKIVTAINKTAKTFASLYTTLKKNKIYVITSTNSFYSDLFAIYLTYMKFGLSLLGVDPPSAM